MIFTKYYILYSVANVEELKKYLDIYFFMWATKRRYLIKSSWSSILWVLSKHDLNGIPGLHPGRVPAVPVPGLQQQCPHRGREELRLEAGRHAGQERVNCPHSGHQLVVVGEGEGGLLHLQYSTVQYSTVQTPAPRSWPPSAPPPSLAAWTQRPGLLCPGTLGCMSQHPENKYFL